MLKSKFFLCLTLLCMGLLSGCSFIPTQKDIQPLMLTSVQTVEKIDYAKIEKINAKQISLDTTPLPKEPTYVSQRDIDCMSKTIYLEARGEGHKGMVAVGYVIRNRTLDSRFPNTVCGVVREAKYAQGKPIKGTCQFSWVCDSKPVKIRDKEKFEEAQQLARLIISEQVKNPVGDSLFFHAKYVKPNWKKRKLTHRLGNHIFYA